MHLFMLNTKHMSLFIFYLCIIILQVPVIVMLIATSCIEKLNMLYENTGVAFMTVAERLGDWEIKFPAIRV